MKKIDHPCFVTDIADTLAGTLLDGRRWQGVDGGAQRTRGAARGWSLTI
jgi:hypothetical protein